MNCSLLNAFEVLLYLLKFAPVEPVHGVDGLLPAQIHGVPDHVGYLGGQEAAGNLTAPVLAFVQEVIDEG